jgi:hypothetical protein
MRPLNERLDVLVLHGMPELAGERRTKLRHLFALQRYAVNHRFAYHYFGDPVTDALRSIPFGAIVLDCNFLGWRWSRPRQIFLDIKGRYEWLRDHGAVIAAFPQDDFDHATYLDEWLAWLGTDVLFSVYRHHWDVLYPRLIASGTEIVASYAGYVDDDDVTEYHALRKPFRERTIDVGYRVNRLPANFGRFGVLKSEFGRAFARAASKRARCDISDDPKDTIYGELWPRFLGDSKFTLGSEAGSSVLDPSGEIQDRVQAFALENPTASFEESWSACVRPEDEGWTFPATSPRIFEAAMAGSCPILLEGDYDGLIAPDEHFISVKCDFSDIESALDRLADLDGAEAMAARFERTILGNPALRYKSWVERVVVPKLLELGGTRRDSLSDWEFAFRLEQHRAAMARAKVADINILKEQMQGLKNEANAERLRLVQSIEQQQQLIDQLRIARRPLSRVIASRIKSRLLSR